MYHDNVADLNLLPNRMRALLVGAGEGSFIGRTVWQPTLRSIPDIELSYVCPSRKAKLAERYRKIHEMDKDTCSEDFDVLLGTALEGFGPDEVMVCLATETSTHAGLILKALKAGVKNIVCDKPITARTDECDAISEVLKQSPGAQIYVTFNHRYNAAIFLLQKIVEQARNEGCAVDIESAFHQNWLLSDTTSKQARSRLADTRCTILDLGVHIADLVAFVAGTNITSVSNGYVNAGLGGEFGNVITEASCSYGFAQPLVTAKGDVNQCKPGDFLDDIWVKVTIPSKDVRYLWRMRECGGDNLLVGKASAGINRRGDWQLLERGSERFDAKIAATFNMHPPGHGSCSWGMMWRYLFTSILGDIWRRQNLPIVGYMHSAFSLPVPTFDGAGLATMRYVDAHLASAARLGEETLLA